MVFGSKFICPKGLGVSEKIIGTCGDNFFRNPNKFFCEGFEFLILHSENNLQLSDIGKVASVLRFREKLGKPIRELLRKQKITTH